MPRLDRDREFDLGLAVAAGLSQAMSGVLDQPEGKDCLQTEDVASHLVNVADEMKQEGAPEDDLTSQASSVYVFGVALRGFFNEKGFVPEVVAGTEVEEE